MSYVRVIVTGLTPCGVDSWSRIISISLLLFVIGLPSYSDCAADDPPIGICAMTGCNCTTLAHTWINVKCIFRRDQEVELGEGSVPAEAIDVGISHCRVLRIQSGAFRGGPQLRRVHVSSVKSVVANEQAFHNLSAPSPSFVVSECENVVFESHAFKNSIGPLSVSIDRCRHVRIKPNVFTWLLKIEVRDVKDLVLSSNSFNFEAHDRGKHGPATQIIFERVEVQEFPPRTFPSTAMEIRMNNIEVKVIKKDAFYAMNILNVKISNATIDTIETGAFNGRTLIVNLEFADVNIARIKSGALAAPVTNFTIRWSRVNETETDAINALAATITLNNNIFQRISRNGITMREWNYVTIHQNRFENIEDDAISLRLSENQEIHEEFSFTENRIVEAAPGSLKFAMLTDNLRKSTLRGNLFEEKCSCNLDSWMRKLAGTNKSVEKLLNSSSCDVDEFGNRCFNVMMGKMPMGNFTSIICKEGHAHIRCKEPVAVPEPSASPPSVGPHVYPREKGYFDVEMSDQEQIEREKRIILIICLAGGFCAILALLGFGIFYVRRRGVCPKLTSGPFGGLASWISQGGGGGSRGMAAATSARSISRMSVNEYAGLRPETRVLDLEAPLGSDGRAEDEGLYSYAENKATQTLPEELTEEYLRDLRERLDDPDDYGEAREMIEHLYDLIKVEESCNNNNNKRENPPEARYDAVQRPRGHRGPPRASTSVGTRAPSLDKLFPSTVGPRSRVVEYAEPRDSRANVTDQNHLYAELLGDETVPSTSRLSQSISNRPQLPLVVANGAGDKKEATGKRGNNNSQGKCQTRPLSFLKALGESILGNSPATNKRPNNSNGNANAPPLLCEYAEPSDAADPHLYSELSEPQSQTNSRPPSKMANRPLPTKPGENDAATTIKKA